MKSLLRRGFFFLFDNPTILLSLMLLIGRLSGFLREMLLVKIFGVSGNADIAIVLLTLPDVFTGLLLAGGLTAVLVPAFKKLDANGAQILFIQVSLLIFAVFGVFALAIFFWPETVIYLFAPGLADSYLESNRLIWLCVGFSVVLTAMTGASSALLNSNNRFGITGAGTLIFNSVVIAGLVLLNIAFDVIVVFSMFVAMACLARFVSQIVGIGSFSLSKVFSRNFITRELLLSFVSAFGATSLIVLVPVILRSVGSLMGPGSLATINYATKLIELPLGIAITTISVVALPALSEKFSKNLLSALNAQFRFDTWRGVVFSVSIGLPLAWFSKEFVVGVFGFGSLSREAILQISDIVKIFTITLPFIAISSMQGALLNASGRSRKFLWGILSAFCCFLLSLIGAFFVKNYYLMVFSTVVFYLSACVFLRVFSGVPIFVLGKDNVFLLLKVTTVSLMCLMITSSAINYLTVESRVISISFATISVLVSFLFSVWVLNRVKKNF